MVLSILQFYNSLCVSVCAWRWGRGRWGGGEVSMRNNDVLNGTVEFYISLCVSECAGVGKGLGK